MLLADFKEYVDKIDVSKSSKELNVLILLKVLLENVNKNGIVSALVVSESYKEFYSKWKEDGLSKNPILEKEDKVLAKASLMDIIKMIINGSFKKLYHRRFVLFGTNKNNDKKYFYFNGALWKQFTDDDILLFKETIDSKINVFLANN